MNLLIVNAGSSSLKFAWYDLTARQPKLIASANHTSDRADSIKQLHEFIAQRRQSTPLVVAHRFVHGGFDFTAPIKITAETFAKLTALTPLAPLHNPYACELVTEVKKSIPPQSVQIAVFDSAYYANLPEIAQTYALPASVCRRHRLRRFGFHGFAHEHMALRWIELTKSSQPKKLITLQLGSGCSITATHDHQPLDTSMGFTPLEGLVMGTRCGDLDPGLLLYLQREQHYTADQLEQLLNTESGLLGISEESADMRDLTQSNSKAAQLAIDIFCYRASKYIGAYLAVLNGVDAIVFGGGIGENTPVVRTKILHNLAWCGIHLDAKKNQRCNGQDGSISTASSRTDIWIINVNEERLIASKIQQFLQV